MSTRESRNRGRAYPHMCRDGHEEIGFSSDRETCPLCEVRAENLTLRDNENWKGRCLAERRERAAIHRPETPKP